MFIQRLALDELLIEDSLISYLGRASTELFSKDNTIFLE